MESPPAEKRTPPTRNDVPVYLISHKNTQAPEKRNRTQYEGLMEDGSTTWIKRRRLAEDQDTEFLVDEYNESLQ